MHKIHFRLVHLCGMDFALPGLRDAHRSMQLEGVVTVAMAPPNTWPLECGDRLVCYHKV